MGLPNVIGFKDQYGKVLSYQLIILRVESFNEKGEPFEVSIIKQDDVAELSTDPTKNLFMTAYVPNPMPRESSAKKN